MRIFGWAFSAVRLPPAAAPDPDQRMYMDAAVLVHRAISGRHWSRRTSGLPERRWRLAYALLTAAEVVSPDGMIHRDFITAIGLLWIYHAAQIQLRNAGRYVPAAPPRK